MNEDYGSKIRAAEVRRQKARLEARQAAESLARLIEEARAAGVPMAELAEVSGIERTNLYRLLGSGPAGQG